MVEYLKRRYYKPRKLQMRACHPRDLVEQVVDMCRYQETQAADHARAARCGVRELLPRGDRVAGGRGMKRAMRCGAARRLLCAWSRSHAVAGAARRALSSRLSSQRVAVVIAVHLMAVRLGTDFLPTGRMTGLLLLASEALVVVLTVFPPSARHRGSQPRARVLTALVDARTAAGAARARHGDRAGGDHRRGVGRGLLVVIAGKLSLGRSFGLMPANRGIVSTGLYRLVRHPIYLGYLITHDAFVAANPIALEHRCCWLLADSALLRRAVCEERTLAQDPPVSRVHAARPLARRARRVLNSVFRSCLSSRNSDIAGVLRYRGSSRPWRRGATRDRRRTPRPAGGVERVSARFRAERLCRGRV